ncbi:MAG: lipoprotein [Gammaproteobacteria bacterium]|jgi:predicted small lipoprotein YifL
MRDWPLKTRLRGLLTVLPLIAAALLAGCGQKGALILPGAAEQPVAEEPAPVDDSDEQEAETNDAQDDG